jgi:hypothetical protein
LCQKFDLAMFDDSETVEDYAMCLSGMAMHLATLGEEVKDGKIVAKMLRSLPPRFKQIRIKTTRCVDYVCCRSDRAVEGGGKDIRGSVDIIALGQEVVPHRGGVGRAEEEA